MSERRSSRNAVDRVAARIKEHNESKGGGMTSAVEAQKQAAEVARKADAQKAEGALRNPNHNRAKKEPITEEPRPRRRSSGPRIFIDLGKKG